MISSSQWYKNQTITCKERMRHHKNMLARLWSCVVDLLLELISWMSMVITEFCKELVVCDNTSQRQMQHRPVWLSFTTWKPLHVLIPGDHLQRAHQPLIENHYYNRCSYFQSHTQCLMFNVQPFAFIVAFLC